MGRKDSVATVAKISARFEETEVVVNSVREPDPRNYGESIRCELKDE